MSKRKPRGKDALIKKNKIAGEPDFLYNNLPDVIPEPNKLAKTAVQDNESLKFLEFEQVKDLVLKIGNYPDRIAAYLSIPKSRAEKLIKDVYNIGFGMSNLSTPDERRMHKKLHQARLDFLSEKAMNYIVDGNNGKPLSPNEFKQISSEIRNILNDKAKMHGIGNVVIFEQFNQQTNVNLTPAQIGIKDDKALRDLHTNLLEVLQSGMSDDIVDVELED